MNLDDKKLNNFGEAIAEAVSAALGNSFEIVLYDMGKPDHPVVKVLGKNISGVKAGDSGRDDNLNSVLNQCNKEGTIYRSENKIINGKEIRSTIIFFMDAGAMKINFDLSIVTLMEGFFKELGMMEQKKDSQQYSDKLDVKTILPEYLKYGIQITGKEVAKMGKEDKLKVVQFLDERGAFLLRNSIEDVAKALDITRFTVYNYLDEIRKGCSE